ncbi:hypothetical protein Q1695_007793 [Nippostrongylus brasiliensis]|nr:hypothetical protein Q1695_007793 [Nippostrongylus brasiliensis]
MSEAPAAPAPPNAVEEGVIRWKRRMSNDITPTIPPQNRYLDDFRKELQISYKYNMASCQIPFNMANILQSTICFLENPAIFLAQNKSISSPSSGDNRLCDNNRAEKQLNSTQLTQMIADETQFFAVIRDPIDRFISGYIDKCLSNIDTFPEGDQCFGCRDDLRCFIRILYRILIEFQSGKPVTITKLWSYINYFGPQTWFCDFEHRKKRYTLIHYHRGLRAAERIAAQLDKVLTSANVPVDQRAYIRRELSKHKATQESQVARSLKRRIVNDTFVLETLLWMYSGDLFEFGFQNTYNFI